MKLISDIINNLIDSDKTVYVTLLKTKVLATKIENDALLNWVNYELNGYPTDDLLPEYRRNVIGNIIGVYFVGSTKYTNQPIPTSGFKERFGIDLINTTFRQSISALEQLTSGHDSSVLEIPFSAETCGLLEENWKMLDVQNPYSLNIINSKKHVSTVSIKDITFKVRNRLLEFMLEIDKQYGNLTEIKDLTNKNKEITQIMAKTIINTTGDGYLINTGNDNDIKATINIDKSNKEHLEIFLREKGVPQEEIKELTQIIDSDDHNLPAKCFGTKTRSWIQKMMGKSLDGTWNIAIGAAGELLASAIGHYLGF
jgi:hypothetical protein